MLFRSCNKLACRRCKSKCTTSKFKEADFSKDCLIKKVGGRKEDDRRGDNAPQMPFGTSFRNHQADNRRGLLPAAQDVQDRGLEALYCLANNMRRAMNMRTMGELVAGMAE